MTLNQTNALQVQLDTSQATTAYVNPAANLKLAKWSCTLKKAALQFLN